MSGIREWLSEDMGGKPKEARPSLDIIEQNETLYAEYGNFTSD